MAQIQAHAVPPFWPKIAQIHAQTPNWPNTGPGAKWAPKDQKMAQIHAQTPQIQTQTPLNGPK